MDYHNIEDTKQLSRRNHCLNRCPRLGRRQILLFGSCRKIGVTLEVVCGVQRKLHCELNYCKSAQERPIFCMYRKFSAFPYNLEVSNKYSVFDQILYADKKGFRFFFISSLKICTLSKSGILNRLPQ